MLRAWIPVLLCISSVASAAASGCIDARGKFEDFSDRKAEQVDREVAHTPDSGCAMPATLEQLAGRYLFALAAKPAADKPILALLTVVPNAGDIPGGEVLFEPLSLADSMSTVGVKNEGTFQLKGEDLTVPSFHVVLPANANTVLPADAEADLRLAGLVCVLGGAASVESFCGSADGNITAPLELPLAGSTFGAMRIEEGKPWPKFFASCETAVVP